MRKYLQEKIYHMAEILELMISVLLVVVIVAVDKSRIILGAGLVFYIGFQMDID